MRRYNLEVDIRKEKNMFIARSPVLGVASQGHSVKEAVDNVREAIELYLEDPDVQKDITKGKIGLPYFTISIFQPTTFEEGYNEQASPPIV